MKLVHWSKYPVKRLQTYEQKLGQRWDKGWWGPKPVGLWLSDESPGAHGWRKWCTSESFALDRLKYEYRVKLSPDAHILYLTSVNDIAHFTKKFKAVGPLDNDKFFAEMSGKYPGYEPSIMGIDWGRVAQEYQGIVIAPYQWSIRLESRYTWYYGWDCASGCIWDKAAIEDFKLIKQHTVPRKKREVSIKRLNKDLKELTKSLEKYNAKSEREKDASGRISKRPQGRLGYDSPVPKSDGSVGGKGRRAGDAGRDRSPDTVRGKTNAQRQGKAETA